jgi:hypothetical protein
VSVSICWLAIAGRPIPQEMMLLAGATWGFYFGSKAQQAIHAQERRRE